MTHDSPKQVAMNQVRAASPDWTLLLVGLALLVVPLIFAVLYPAEYERVQFYLRVVTALAGGFVGAMIPGRLHVGGPMVRAIGGAAFVLLFWLTDPTGIVRAGAQAYSLDAKNAPLVSLSHDDFTVEKATIEVAHSGAITLTLRTDQKEIPAGKAPWIGFSLSDRSGKSFQVDNFTYQASPSNRGFDITALVKNNGLQSNQLYEFKILLPK